MGGKKTVENSRRFEKDRRDKLNIAFMELCKLLPDHDPSVNLSKVEILRRAAEYIRYLQGQNDEIMKLGEDLALKNESEKLRKRVAHLLLKTKELVEALRSAGVPIPNSKRKKKKPKAPTQGVLLSNQNKTSGSNKAEEAKTSQNGATTIKKVKCGCMKLAPEKKPLKESNPVVTTVPAVVTLGNVATASCVSSASTPPWTNHTKLLNASSTPLISASVMTTRVQSLPVIRPLLPNNNNNNNNNNNTAVSLATIPRGTQLLSNNRAAVDSNVKTLPIVRNGIHNIPIVPSSIQSIPIISNNILPPSIVKEVTPAVISKKNLNIVTTTSSNSIPTQTIVNSTHIITLSQSNIISAPVMAPGIQTVPLLEKNILSNLGPGTLILADGRIVNVPPIVPQILVKPQPTVILMPTAKKKDKIIIPKKLDVTKTTFANKAPIPAIQTFRLESCPRTRPKKKPKTILKKTEKSKITENDTDSERAKKKRKIDNVTTPSEPEKIEKPASIDNMNASKEVDNMNIDTSTSEEVFESVPVDASDRPTEVTSSHDQELSHEIIDVPKSVETVGKPVLPSICQSLVPPATFSDSNLDILTDSELPVTSSTVKDTFDALNGTYEQPPTLKEQAKDPVDHSLNNKSGVETNENNTSSGTNKIDTAGSEIEKRPSNPDGSKNLLVSSSITIESSNAETLAVDSVNGQVLEADTSGVGVNGQVLEAGTSGVGVNGQVLEAGTSGVGNAPASPTNNEVNPGKNNAVTSNLLINQSSVGTTASYETNTNYTLGLAGNLPEANSSTTQVSLFAPNNQANVESKPTSSLSNCQPHNRDYSALDSNLKSSENQSFPQKDTSNSQVLGQSVSDGVTEPSSSTASDNPMLASDSLLTERIQHSLKPNTESNNSSHTSASKVPVSSSSNNDMFQNVQTNREMMQRLDFPDIGSNALVENSTMFSTLNEITHSMSLNIQEKAIYSQALSFQQDKYPSLSNSLSTSVSSLTTVCSKSNPFSIPDGSFSQQQNNHSQQVDQSSLHHNKQKTSLAVDPFCNSSHRSDLPVYSHSSVPFSYSKTNESFSNHPTYRNPETILSDKNSNLNYSDSINKPVNFNSNEKLPCSSSTAISSISQPTNSNANTYTGYCSTNFYPSTASTNSQNHFNIKPTNRTTVTDNLSKKIVPYNTFNDNTPSVALGDKQVSSRNPPVHHSSVATKPNWDKSHYSKDFYNNSMNNMPDGTSIKDKNSSFQCNKMPGLEKQNEMQNQNQLMYLGFQNESVGPYSNSFFQNFPANSAALQGGCSFNDFGSTSSPHTSSLPSKTTNQQESLMNVNPPPVARNPQEKLFRDSQSQINKDNSLTGIDKDNTNNSSFYPVSAQLSAYSNVSKNGPKVQNISFENSSINKSKVPSEGNCSSHNNFIEPKIPFNETSSAVTSTNNIIQNNTSRAIYNNSNIAGTSFVDGKVSDQNCNVDDRRNDNGKSYSKDKEVSKTNRFPETSPMGSQNPSDSNKTSQTNISVQSAPSNSLHIPEEPNRNHENNGYNNYLLKSSVNGKNIQNSNPDNHKINDSIENSQSHFKDYIRNTNNEKQIENHKRLSSAHKSVSTEMNSDDYQVFNYNGNNYQKLPHSQNNSFSSDLSRISTSTMKPTTYKNFDNTPFEPVTNQFVNQNSSSVNTRNPGICSSQTHSLQSLPSTSSSTSDQLTLHSGNKTAPVLAMPNPLSQKSNQASKVCSNEGTSYKGDMNMDFLKSKDIERNTFIPIIDDVRLTSDFSSDLFSSLQVPTGGQHSESISPTAAFLLAFPLVSTSRNNENLPDNENHDNQTSTPTTILQIGNIDPPNTEMFHSIDFQKANKTNDHFELNNDYLHVNGMDGKQNTSYDKTCEKRKDVFPDFNKDQRAIESKSKTKSSNTVTNSYGSQSYNYSNFPCNDFQQYCEKESPQWQQDFPNASKDPKKTYEKKKDKAVQKGYFYQNYQEYYNYKDKKRKQQNRISVNWMTTPENREQAEYQQKEPEIINNYSSHSVQPVYSSISFDFPTESFSDFCSSKKSNNYSWSPSKALLPVLDNNIIPSTLPTLVGDLALGTSTPSESYKTFETPKVQSATGQVPKKPPEKMEEIKKRNEFPKSQANFFSVSQLVDPKSKKQKTTDRNYKRQEKTSKPRANFNCSKRKEDQCMYYEERNNFPMNQNQCNDKKYSSYKGGSYSAESLIGAQQNDVDFSSNFNYQQNSNYFHSDFTPHIDSNQQYSYFQQSHFSGFSHEDYQDFGFGTNQRSLDQNRQKSGRKDDNYQSSNIIQSQIYPSYSKSIHYNLPASQLNTNTTTTLTNFNLSTIFPEMNDQRVATSGQPTQQMNPTFPPSSQTYRSHLQQ